LAHRVALVVIFATGECEQLRFKIRKPRRALRQEHLARFKLGRDDGHLAERSKYRSWRRTFGVTSVARGRLVQPNTDTSTYSFDTLGEIQLRSYAWLATRFTRFKIMSILLFWSSRKMRRQVIYEGFHCGSPAVMLYFCI
jgi:hypothetical protein